MKKVSLAVAGIAAGGLILGFSSAALATITNGTFDLTIDQCSGGCGLTDYGTITVSGDGSTETVSVTLNGTALFHESQGSTASPGLYFDLSGTVSTFTINTGTGFTASGTTAGSFSLDAFGTGNFAALCSGPGPSNTCGNTLKFTITGTGLDFESFSKSQGDVVFVADVLNQGATGPVGAPVPGPIVGAGLPGLIFACGGLLGLARHRRRRQAA